MPGPDRWHSGFEGRKLLNHVAVAVRLELLHDMMGAVRGRRAYAELNIAWVNRYLVD